MTDSSPTVYSIAPGVPFVDALAAGVLKQAGEDPAILPRYTILLPTRRATRSLRDAFLRLTEGRALLLPRMMPLGDLDEEELAIAGAEEGLAAIGDILPAISALRRQVLLARLVMAFQGSKTTPDQAMRLAQELARLLDQAQTERLSFDGLASLVDDDYAQHWQITLEFLSIVTQQWPHVLAEEGCLDPAERRNRVLAAQADHWRNNPPDRPVIAAGSTGSIPATADLLATIAGLPRGCVILPGLDRDAVVGALEPTHPQFGMARLLEHIGIGADGVVDWPAPPFQGTKPGRAKFVADALQPAATTDQWRSMALPALEDLGGLSRMDYAGLEEEAGGIALMMREVLNIPGKTAALVTPDRSLARRVAIELRRWDVDIDDSSGLPLAQTPSGAFLRLTAEVAREACAPVSLLAVCKHPLAAGGQDSASFRRLTRFLERVVLRGPRLAPGIEPLRESIRALADHDYEDYEPAIIEALEKWLTALERSIGEFMILLSSPATSMGDLIRAHILFAEAIAASDTETGQQRLWAADDGEATASFVAELLDGVDALGPIAGRHYPALLDALMAGRVVRPRFGRHPRLFIWGLLEARLQHADLMILGSLNEGSWPPDVQTDPWMSRPMRSQFGLPLPERRIGLAAHDFAQAICAPEVALTRAERVDGTPAVPSRWLVRLDKFLNRDEAVRYLKPSRPWRHWQQALDAPVGDYVQPVAPAPRPPVSARPRRLSVTQIETWMRDPYGIYARHILGLRALSPLDAAPDAADYGTLIHRILDAFSAAYPGGMPDDAEARLRAIGEERFRSVIRYPAVWAFWWPRFERIAAWFIAHESSRIDQIGVTMSEVEGRLTL
ncbi:MAG: double-strand break repair protein AddB, partial [Proteobacteria bacterium]|nr:double-strand break repair protein AddB [Pseudomonadota bacterium]